MDTNWRAARNIVRVVPIPNLFEAMLLGNGDIGACVRVWPDAFGLHLGKEDGDLLLPEDLAPV
jgi:hypothetical protein